MKRTITRTILFLLASASLAVCAAEPAGHTTFSRVPPPGIAIPAEVRAELESGVAALGKEIGELRKRPETAEFLPDVQIYQNAVRYSLEDGTFYRTNEFAAARKLLAEGMERARALQLGRAPWNTATGLVVRGYVSKIDGSVQPYGLVVPASYRPATGRQHRLDFWYHGRGINLTEVNFITERENRIGEFAPADAFVLHPYGRFCNANKFAGETDTFEAWEHARRHYPIDENRVSVRGFSMGGAAVWHLAVHHAGLWAAASPGAGFAETAIFQKIFQKPGAIPPAWYVERLWHLYDATDYAANLFNCPVVAYSGEIDQQKQAADLMARAMAAEGLNLVHIIGPKTGHQFEPKAKAEVAARMDALLEKGRDPLPRRVRFTTWTLRYNEQAWVTVDALGKHWQRARVEAEIAGSSRVKLETENVTALTLAMPAGLCPFKGAPPVVELDHQELAGPPVAADRSWTAHFEKRGGQWVAADGAGEEGLRKRHGLQGPVDDAFMESFIMVRPSGKAATPAGEWAEAEMHEAIRQWRLQFRGEPRVKFDFAITDEDIASSHLVLWGDPQSNELLRRILGQLPVKWSKRTLRVAAGTYPAETHLPVLIYPNPLNPARYVVLNSGFTFADEGPTSNALQVPKLPDYAVLDTGAAGAPVAAGFFDERWRFSPVE